MRQDGEEMRQVRSVVFEENVVAGRVVDGEIDVDLVERKTGVGKH